MIRFTARQGECSFCDDRTLVAESQTVSARKSGRVVPASICEDCVKAAAAELRSVPRKQPDDLRWLDLDEDCDA